MSLVSRTVSTGVDIAKSLALLAFLCLPTEGNAEDMCLCISLDRVWGDKYNRNDSLHIIVTNNCPSATFIKMCIEEKDGGWSCGTDNNLRRGDTNRGFWACSATGDYTYAACTGGYGECGFRK